MFDVLARDRIADRLLVVDYKSDRLGGGAPETIVAERYGAQRTIYALAALKLGAADVEVLHLFLEAPEEPVQPWSARRPTVPRSEARAGRTPGRHAGQPTSR